MAQNDAFELVNLIHAGDAAAVRNFLITRRQTQQQPHGGNNSGGDDGHPRECCLVNARLSPQIDASCGTPLCVAIQHLKFEIAAILVEAFGADARLYNAREETPLHLAVRCGRAVAPHSLIRLLITQGAALVDARDERGRTALHYALVSSDLELVTVLVSEFGASAAILDSEYNSPLHLCAKYTSPKSASPELALFLVEKGGAKVRDCIGNVDGASPLLLAVLNNNLPFVKVMVETFGEDCFDPSRHVDKDGATILHASVLTCLADSSMLPCIASLYRKRRVLMSAVTPQEENNVAPLLPALLSPSDVVHINSKDKGGRTPLHLATHTPGIGLDVVRLLIEEMGADVSIRDRQGSTPLHAAIRRYASPEIIRYLIGVAGADVDEQDNQLKTPLMLTINSRALLAAKILVNEFGADVSIGDHTYLTPLDVAIKRDMNDFVTLLVERGGADVRGACGGGQRARLAPSNSVEEKGGRDVGRRLQTRHNHRQRTVTSFMSASPAIVNYLKGEWGNAVRGFGRAR